MTTTEKVEQLSKEIEDRCVPTPREAADALARYERVHYAPRLVADRRTVEALRNLAERDGHVDVEGLGRLELAVPTDAAWKKADQQLNDYVKYFLERDEEHALFVEGVGEARLQPRDKRTVRIAAIFAEEPGLFDELLQKGALTVDLGVADALMKAGQLQGLSKFIVRGEGTPALVIDRKAARR
jgi:hypothetical protein